MTDELNKLLHQLVDIVDNKELTPIGQYLRMKDGIKELKKYLDEEKKDEC